jgi:hypothetical protein
MSDPQRILVVAGARALSRTPAARSWALAKIATMMHDLRVTAVCHGACPDSPDEWAEGIARVATLAFIRWPAGGTPSVSRYSETGGIFRNVAGHEGYPYVRPLERNAAMATWAGDRLRAGDEVHALTLRCPWPMADGRTTQGTAHARDHLVRALGAERVVDLVCPREHGPTTEGR